MCPPVLAIAAGAASIVGAGVSIYGQYKAAEAEEKAGEHNKRMAEITARDIEFQGQLQAGAITSEATRLIARQRAMIAGSGIDVGSGSAVEIQAESRARATMDVKTTRLNAGRQAWAVRQQGKYFNAAAHAAAATHRLNAVGTALGGLGQAARNTNEIIKMF